MPTFTSQGLDLFFFEPTPSAPQVGLPVVLIHGFASNHRVNWINPLWVKTLSEAGRRVLAFDNRGHGASEKPHDPAAYHTERMAADVIALLDRAGIEQAHLLGYSMGARIAAFVARAAPSRVRSAVFGGLGIHLVEAGGLSQAIGPAMLAPSLDRVTDPVGRLFRRFAEANGSDLLALAACIEGSRQWLSAEQVSTLDMPILVAVGDKDPIAGDPHRLASLLPRGQALDIPGRDHNLAVGDKVFKAAVLDFITASD